MRQVGWNVSIPRKTGISGAFIAIAVGVALLAAQGIVLNHDLDLDGHAGDSVCEFCLAGAGLAGADIGPAKQPFALPGVSPRVPAWVRRAHSEYLLRYHFARAPPTSS